MPHSDFIHLHLHTQYSLLDGACQLKKLVELASRYKMPSLAITDHGNLFAAIEFYQEAQNAGIKPIIGCEMYIAPKSRFEKSSSAIQEASYHFILLCKDEEGYHNLMRLVSIGYLEGFYYRPRIDKEALAKYSKGLIGLSACLKGEIPAHLQNNQYNLAIKCADDFAQILGKDNFYLELQENKIPEQDACNQGLLRIAKELSLPIVATNDVHYLTKETAKAHEALLCIQTQTTLSDPQHMRFQSDEFYFKTQDEMKALFREHPEAIANTVDIAERCNLELDFKKLHLPHYQPPEGLSKDEFLRKLCEAGLARRFPDGATAEIKERLEHELATIKKIGFTSYFLIVWDFIHFAKSRGIPVGPGRGSAAGSLVSYLLCVTDINPLKYGLLFERFLNPERIGLPDIDIDFCYERRQEVIDYVTQKYGRQNVAQIITFGTMLARAVIRDVGRVMGMSYADVDRIAKLVPAELNITLDDALTQEPELRHLCETDQAIAQLIDTARSLEGLTRHASTHAAGVVISDAPLEQYLPLFKSSEDLITTGYSMEALEKIGLLKIDFLGLRTLTVVQRACEIVKHRHNKEINIDTLPLDDQKTFQLLSSALTSGIFQLESNGMRDLLRKIRPDKFEDLIAILALYRPGPMGSGMLEDFIARKSNNTAVHYESKKMEPILKATYGIMVYQEQVMQIASELAGFSLSQADILRKAMAKKIPEVIERQRKNFVEGCKKNNIREAAANKIFDQIEYFSGYGFNKCVIGSTHITDADSGKVITVKELYDKKHATQHTYSLSDDLKIVKSKINSVFANGRKAVYRLKTSLGKEITATGNHPFYTINGWKYLRDLCIGERIGLPRQIPAPERNAEAIEDYKLAALAGILSEGNTCHPSGVYFYNNDKDMVDDFIRNARQFSDTEPTIRLRRKRYEVYCGTGRDARFSPAQNPWNRGFCKNTYMDAKAQIENRKSGLRQWVEELNLDNKKAGEKTIPDIIFSLGKEQLALFVGRLWSGDGFIFSKNNTIPFYASASKTLCLQLQELLLRFDITSRLCEKRFKYKYKGNASYKTGYCLYLYARQSVSAFISQIAPHIIGRKKQIESMASHYKRISPGLESKDTMPAEIKYIVKEEKDKSGLSWKELESRTGVCMKEFYGRVKSYKKGFRRKTILQLAQFFESRKLLSLANSDILWDSVKSIEFSGTEETYDLEISQTHNFIADGIIVHNSHSAAYAMISYRTAYLKANYPVEFMAALLTSEKDNTDKIVEYVAECQRMGIEVLPPDVNESRDIFTVVDESKIRFGLIAVKNVGQGAIESILRVRDQRGKFSCLEDFCEHLDLRLVNRKVIESLIKAGAMDGFGLYRAQAMVNLERVLQMSSKSQKEKLTGQLSFFDLGPENGFKKNVAEPPSQQVREWPEPQLLAFEKEMLGFYVTGHPLARFANQLKRFASCSIASLHTHKDADPIKLAGFIAKIKNTVTRKSGEKMAILKLEDLSGAVEILVFPEAYRQNSRYIQPNSAVLIQGRLNLREEAPKIILNSIIPLEEAYKQISKIDINIAGLKDNLLASLKQTLSEHSGPTPVYLHIDSPNRARLQILVSNELHVQPNQNLIQDIGTLLGEERFSLTL